MLNLGAIFNPDVIEVVRPDSAKRPHLHPDEHTGGHPQDGEEEAE